MDPWLFDKEMLHLPPFWCLGHGSNERCIQQTFKSDRTSSLSPICTVAIIGSVVVRRTSTFFPLETVMLAAEHRQFPFLTTNK